MKIVHVIDYFQPALGYQETFLLKAHRKAGHDAAVVTSDRYAPQLYAGGDEHPILGPRMVGQGLREEDGIPTWRLPCSFEYAKGSRVWLKGMEARIRALDPDVVVSHEVASFCTLRLVRMRRRGARFRLVCDEHATGDNSPSRLHDVFRWTLSPLVQRGTDGLVAITPDTVEFMARRYAIPRERITLIPLGADVGRFRRDEEARARLRREMDLGDAMVVIYTGKLLPAKRVDLLVDALALLPDPQAARLLIVGSGPEEDALRARARERGVGHLVRFQAAVPNARLHEWYSAADVGAWPREATAGIQEAMACGLPVLVGKESRVTDLVRRGNGHVCEADPEDVAQKIAGLLDPRVREDMGRRSRALVEEELDWNVLAERFVRLATGGA